MGIPTGYSHLCVWWLNVVSSSATAPIACALQKDGLQCHGSLAELCAWENKVPLGV